MVILQVSGRMNGYLARFWQKIGYLARFWQKNGYLARFWQKSCKIMHNLARFWQNLPESCKITIRNRLGYKLYVTLKQFSFPIDEGMQILQDFLQDYKQHLQNFDFLDE